MKTILLGMLLVLGGSGIAQTLESLEPLMLKMHDANYTMDFEPIADLTYPAIVEQLGGRAAFIDKLDHDYQNTDFRKRIQLEKPALQFGAIKDIEGRRCCLITYYNPIRYFIEQPLDAVSGPRKAAELKLLTHALQTTYEPKRNTVNVRRNSTFIAIADSTTNNQWKLIDLDDEQQGQATNSLLNENIKKQLGL